MEQTVGRFGSRTEAEIVRQLLDDAGIPARLLADDVGALHPELGQVGERHGITLVVADEHVEEARAFLAATEDTRGELPEGWEEPDRSRRRLRVTAAAVLVLAVAIGIGVEFAETIARWR